MADKSEHVLSDTAGKYPMAPKVKWGALWAGLAPLLATWAYGVFTEGTMITGLPDWFTGVLVFILAGGASGIAGYTARHQSRDDLPRANGGINPSGGQVG